MDNEKLLAIKLADSDKKVRDKSMMQIRNYIHSKTKKESEPFTEEDMIKLWKGLHYNMWMCDKALIQQELTDRICNLLNHFNDNSKQIFLFVSVYFKTIVREWIGIDKWRIDKFMMLMRAMIKQTFVYISSHGWTVKHINKFNKMLLGCPLDINNDSCPDGVTYHVTDVFIEELAKVGENLKPKRAVKLLAPFIHLMAVSKKTPFVLHVKKRLFEQIIECSDVGVDPEIEEELEDTKAFGLQIGEIEDKSEHILKFNYDLIAKRLYAAANTKDCIVRNKKQIFDLVKKFKALAKGVYPIDDYNFPQMYDEEERKFKQRIFKKSKFDKKKKGSKKTSKLTK